MSDENALGEEIQQIRDRLRAMKTELEAAMNRLVESREHAEAQRQVRVDTERPRDEPSAQP